MPLDHQVRFSLSCKSWRFKCSKLHQLLLRCFHWCWIPESGFVHAFLAPTIQSKENANCVILCTLRIGCESQRMQVSASTCTDLSNVFSAVPEFEDALCLQFMSLDWTEPIRWTRFHVGMVNIGTPSLSAHHFLGYPASCNLPILLPPYRSPSTCPLFMMENPNIWGQSLQFHAKIIRTWRPAQHGGHSTFWNPPRFALFPYSLVPLRLFACSKSWFDRLKGRNIQRL